MQLYVISFTVKATQQKSWLTMNHHFNISQNGGNNWLENLKVKTLGQFIQEGTRNLFETVVRVDKPRKNVVIPELAEDLDGLGYLQGKDVDFVNKKATDGVLLAHTDGDVPNMFITIPEQDAFTLGYIIYFFEIAIALSGYLNAVNPFNQPGVEAYKKNMFALLGKPGFEELGAELNARL